MKRRAQQSGIGLVETVVAAAILSTSIAGTVALTSSTLQTTTTSTNNIDAAVMGTAAVEIAQFNPDATYINTQISGMQTASARSSYTLDGVSVSGAGSTDGVSVTVSWTNPYLDSENKTQTFTLGSNVSTNDSFQTMQNVVGTDSGGGSPTTYTVSTSAGTGTSISPSSRQVNSGDNTTFTVTLSTGYESLSVSGCSGSLVGDTFTTGTITSNCTVTASATQSTYTVTENGAGIASVSCNDTTVAHGATTTCSATLTASGYENLTLSGCSGSGDATSYTTGVVTGDCTVTASASLIQYTVSTTANAGTSISPTSAAVDHGSTTAFTIQLISGAYTGLTASGCGGSLVSTTFTTGAITSNCTVIASASSANSDPTAVDDAASITEDVSSSVGGNVLSNDSDSDGGTLAATPATPTLTYGSLALASDGSYTYTLDNSALNSLNTGQSDTDTYVYTVSDGQGGSATATLTITVNGADEANVAPTASDDATSITEDVATQVSGNVITNDSDSDGGTLTVTPATPSLTYGSLSLASDGAYTYTLTDSALDSLDNGQQATDTYVYTLSDGQGGSDTATLTITINGADEITVSVSEGTGVAVGSLSCNDATVSPGETTTCTATAATGYENLTLSGCNGVSGGSPYTTGAISGACTVSASASLIDYTVSTSAGTGTTLTPSSRTVSHGGTTTFTASTDTGYESLSVSGCSGSLDGSTYTTGAITGNCTVSSSASLIQYTVSASAGTGTTLTPSSRTVDHGSTTTFTAALQAGYESLVVTGCSGTLDGDTYTTGAITEACTVSASATPSASSWTAAVDFTVSSSGGNGKYSVIVSFDGTQECSTPTSGGGELSAPTGYTCDIETTASSVTASYSVTADQYLCSVTETSGSTTLTDSGPTLSVAVVVANNSRSCP